MLRQEKTADLLNLAHLLTKVIGHLPHHIALRQGGNLALRHQVVHLGGKGRRLDIAVNVNRLDGVYDLINRPELKYKPFVPSIPSKITLKSDMFETIRKQDVLLHHPYQANIH